MLFSILSVLPAAAAFSDAFSFGCAPETVQRSDPLLSPGGPSQHVHAVVGGNAFSRNMSDPDAAKNSNSTSCDIPSDHSNYWHPQLYHINSDGTFTIVPFKGTGIYYENRACNNSFLGVGCSTYTISSNAFPEGFRMIAGNSTRRTYDASNVANQAISLYCDGQTYHGTFPPNGCQQMRAQATFPSCWDGKTLWAEDQSHVSYPENYDGGVCPASHPVAIFSIFTEWTYDFYDYASQKWLFNDNNFVFANGDTTGNGFHADFINGWQNLTVLQNAFANCNATTCEVRTFGLPPGETSPAQETQPLATPAIFEEDIGLQGNSIAKLPGNNPVYQAGS